MPSDTFGQDRWRKGTKDKSRGGPLEGQDRLKLVPTPPSLGLV